MRENVKSSDNEQPKDNDGVRENGFKTSYKNTRQGGPDKIETSFENASQVEDRVERDKQTQENEDSGVVDLNNKDDDLE